MSWKDHDQAFEANRRLWDRRTSVHLKSEFYDNENFVKHQNSLMPIELASLPSLKGKRVLHLQCHFGQDSISLSRLGAEVVGVDLSPAGIEAAVELNQRCGTDVKFVCCNVYDIASQDLGNFDLVFTSYGTICWLPDLVEWARLIKLHLKAGGMFHIVDFHPILYMIEWQDKEWKYPYFSHDIPYEDLDETSYTENKEKIALPSYFWQHPTSEVITSLLGEGMQLTKFAEYDWAPYNCFPLMEKLGEKRYQYVYPHQPVPHTFEIQCVTL